MNILLNKPSPVTYTALVMEHYTENTKEEAKKEINLVDVLKGAIVTVAFRTGMCISH